MAGLAQAWIGFQLLRTAEANRKKVRRRSAEQRPPLPVSKLKNRSIAPRRKGADLNPAPEQNIRKILFNKTNETDPEVETMFRRRERPDRQLLIMESAETIYYSADDESSSMFSEVSD